MFNIFVRIAKNTDLFHTKVKLGCGIIFLSSKLTSFLIFAFCVIITSHQYFGDPIQCVQDTNGDRAAIPEKVLNSFCFISATYTTPKPKDVWANGTSGGSIRLHSYYPWVPVILFLQGLSFMIPQGYWMMSENGFLEKCLRNSSRLSDEHLLPLAKYISKRINSFGGWSRRCVFSELLYIIVVCGNFMIADIFLGGNFLRYSYEFLVCEQRLHEETIFPKMIKCSFYKYGASGTIEQRDALCLMTLNVINEKLYLFLWAWFFLLIIVSALVLLHRFFFMFILTLKFKCTFFIKILLTRDVTQNSILIFKKKLHISDWIFIEQVKYNMDSKSFKKLLESIVIEISEPYDLILFGRNPTIYTL